MRRRWWMGPLSLGLSLSLGCDDGSSPARPADCGPGCAPDGAITDAGPDARLEDAGADAAPDAALPEPGALASFRPDFDPRDPAQFFDFPYPSDLRLTADGRPDLAGLPDPHELALINGVFSTAGDRRGFPATPVAWFRFDAPLPELDPETIHQGPGAALWLLDVDPDSPETGRAYPVQARRLSPDAYVPENVLAVAARPGLVLRPETTYAFVVLRALRDAEGRLLGVPAELAALAADAEDADGDLAAHYAPLWPALDAAGIERAEVAAATVFTTGDVIADLYTLTEQVRRDHSGTELTLRRRPNRDTDRFCVLRGTLRLPQFQQGVPPFDADGLFELDAQGAPVVQRQEDVPIGIAIPRRPMPPAGYPLALYFHGSGGVSMQFVDAGPQGADRVPAAGRGPAWIYADHGIASAGSAHPVSPERVPGAPETAYLNFNNLAAFRDTFRQGVIEQRLYLDALIELELPADQLADCEGATLPEGVDHFRFDVERIMGQGQSMGGMYTNLIGAVEPRLKALVPTGAGGYWSYFILETSLIPNIPRLLSGLLRTGRDLSFMHPVLHATQTAWEVSDPMVAMPRLSRRPLPGFPVRPIYQPIGQEDSYFPTPVLDAMALAFGHPQAGDVIWPELQDALALIGLDGIRPYPIRQNLLSDDGRPFTGIAVQYARDPFGDGHQIYRQLDAVKHQYGCFLASFVATGVAVVPAPAPLGSPCPGLE